MTMHVSWTMVSIGTELLTRCCRLISRPVIYMYIYMYIITDTHLFIYMYSFVNLLLRFLSYIVCVYMYMYVTVQFVFVCVNFKFYHMLMFNCSFLSRLVPESNKIWYLDRTRTCLKELKVLLVLLIRRLKNISWINHFWKSNKTDFRMHSHKYNGVHSYINSYMCNVHVYTH